MKVKKAPSPRGRPRAFDIDEALDRAMRVFWRKGYEGASLTDLTEAMGINRPSLYAAFGDKEALFRRVLDRYDNGPAAYIGKALEEPTARAVAERLLRAAADLQTDSRNPGCLMVQGALACGDAARGVRRELTSRRKAAESAIRRRFQRAQAEGDLPPHSDPAGLALYIATIVRGMAVQAAGGTTRKELGRVIRTALRAWPE